MRQTAGAAASGTFAARCPAMLCTAVPRLYIAWRSGQALNLQPTVLETAALPLELPEYKSRPWNRTSRVYTHAPRSILRSGGHIKTAPVLRRGCWLAHILSGKLHLGKDSKAFFVTGGCTCGLAGCLVHAPYGARLRSRTVPQNCQPCYVASQTSHRSSPQNGEGEQESMKTCHKEGPFWRLRGKRLPLSAEPLIRILHLSLQT